MISPEAREKIRLSKLGDKNPMKRKEVREKVSKARMGMKCPYVGERNKRYTGKANHNYKDGSYTGLNNYVFLREFVKKHMKWACEKCGKKRSSKDIDLVIHHKNVNREDNRIANLAVLCNVCHNGLHMNEYWRKKNE